MAETNTQEKDKGLFDSIKDKVSDMYETAQAENEADGGSGFADKVGDFVNTVTLGGFDKVKDDILRNKIDTKELSSDMTKDQKVSKLKSMWAESNKKGFSNEKPDAKSEKKSEEKDNATDELSSLDKAQLIAESAAAGQTITDKAFDANKDGMVDVRDSSEFLRMDQQESSDDMEPDM